MVSDRRALIRVIFSICGAIAAVVSCLIIADYTSSIMVRPGVFAIIEKTGASLGPRLLAGYNVPEFTEAWGEIDAITIQSKIVPLSPHLPTQGISCYFSYFASANINVWMLMPLVFYYSFLLLNAKKIAWSQKIILWAGVVAIFSGLFFAYLLTRIVWTGAIASHEITLRDIAQRRGDNVWAFELLASGSLSHLALIAGVGWSLGLLLAALTRYYLGPDRESEPIRSRSWILRIATVIALSLLWTAPLSLTYTLAPYFAQVRDLDYSLGLYWLTDAPVGD